LGLKPRYEHGLCLHALVLSENRVADIFGG
jgi:hypothetical protein